MGALPLWQYPTGQGHGRAAGLARVAVSTDDKIRSNVIRIQSHDCIDEAVKIFSNVSASHRLPKHTTDDFSWPKDDIVVVKNLSEQDCAVSLEMLRTDSDYIVLRSSRLSARILYQGEKCSHTLHAGEAWTLRACDALANGSQLSI
jgi:hypothetical protein